MIRSYRGNIYEFFRELFDEIEYFFTNCFVGNLHIWHIRKLFYKILGMKIGRNSRILRKTEIINPRGIVIGTNTIVNENCYLDGRGGITIGSNTTIAAFTKIITGYHSLDDDSFKYLKANISIGDNCAVFVGGILLPGVVMLKGSVIAAGSVATKGVYKMNTIYAGNPAGEKRIREISDNYLPNKWLPLIR